MSVQVFIQLIGGTRIPISLEPELSASSLHELVSQAVGRPVGSFKLVSKGKLVPSSDSTSNVKMSDNDVIVVVPARKAASPSLVAAALETQRGGARTADDSDDDDDEGEPAARLPDGAPSWEVALIGAIRRSGRCSNTALEWLVLLRPLRILMLILFMGGCLVASKFNLGPPFILISMIIAIFCNLGRRKQGEMSAYSIFNPGVRRLPGQLDAEDIDRQIRQGRFGHGF